MRRRPPFGCRADRQSEKCGTAYSRLVATDWLQDGCPEHQSSRDSQEECDHADRLRPRRRERRQGLAHEPVLSPGSILLRFRPIMMIMYMRHVRRAGTVKLAESSLLFGRSRVVGKRGDETLEIS